MTTLILALLSGSPMTTEDPRALALYVLTPARRGRERQKADDGEDSRIRPQCYPLVTPTCQ